LKGCVGCSKQEQKQKPARIVAIDKADDTTMR
jgi:hypothetical protein